MSNSLARCYLDAQEYDLWKMLVAPDYYNQIDIKVLVDLVIFTLKQRL